MPIDFTLELRKQLDFIISSCRLYDDGRIEEAYRISVAARVLFHNTRVSKGIIGGHSCLPGLKLLSTTSFFPGFPIKPESHFLGFVGVDPSIQGFRPFLNDALRKQEIPWREWWDEEPILAITKNQESITRKGLILACANKDGGAHVDELKPQEYKRLEDGLGLEVVVKFRGRATPEKVKLRYANLAALRQIGHEILSSPDLQKLAKQS